MNKVVPRIGDWMQTYTGRQFWPMDPRPDEIEIEDIAHSLAMQCRYAGHCLRFYSVAEHSVHIARWLTRNGSMPQVAMWGLLHDASEAYLVDVPRPLKPFLPGYREAEDAVMNAVIKRFNLFPAMPAQVKQLDLAMLADESSQNMADPPEPWNLPVEPLGVTLRYWSPTAAKSQFLRAFYAISQALPTPPHTGKE